MSYIVDGSDSHLVISKGYLNNGNKTEIYLDLIHELCHVKQFMEEGKETTSSPQIRVTFDRPAEIYSLPLCCSRSKTPWLSRKRSAVTFAQNGWTMKLSSCDSPKSLTLQIPLTLIINPEHSLSAKFPKSEVFNYKFFYHLTPIFSRKASSDRTLSKASAKPSLSHRLTSNPFPVSNSLTDPANVKSKRWHRVGLRLRHYDTLPLLIEGKTRNICSVVR